MRFLAVARLALAIALGMGCVTAEDAADATDAAAAKAAVEAVRMALMHGDAAEAAALVDAPLRPRALREFERIVPEFTAGRMNWTVLEVETDGNAALVFIDEDLEKGRATTDIDAMPLVRRAGRWFLLITTEPTDPEIALDAETLAAFARLQAWATEREPLLQKQRRDLLKAQRKANKVVP